MTNPDDRTPKISPLALVAIVFAAITGGAAVALGALAAHRLGPPASGLVEIAARYAMWHALAMIGTALAADRMIRGRALATLALFLFAAGIVLFSGGLTALAFGIDIRTAPFGGTAFILGWITLAAAAVVALTRRA